MSFIAAAVIIGGSAIVGAGVGYASNTKNRRRKRDQQRKFDELMSDYEASEFQPLDREALRRENVFEGQENIMEDMEVDTQAVDYAREQFQQQQANIMQGLRGVAGTSGAAGLAQALSGQASQQARESQLTIGGQLQQARRMRLQEQSRMSQQVLAEESRLSQADRAVQMANMEGVRQFELDKMTTMMGVSGQTIAGLQESIAQNQKMWMDTGASVGSSMGNLYMAGTGTGTGGGGTGGGSSTSDRKLKKNINLIGKSPSGLNIYSFEFKDSKHGKGLFKGVMSDEVPKDAVTKTDGYDVVDYSKLDVEFKQI